MPRRFHVALSVDLAGVYDDNITLSHADPIDDFYGRVSPSIMFAFGDIAGGEASHLLVRYTPSAVLYADHSDLDTVEHFGEIEGFHRFRRLALSLAANVTSAQNTTAATIGAGTGFAHSPVDVAGRERFVSFSTRATATYDLTGKTSLTAGVTYGGNSFQDLISSSSLAGTLGIDYSPREKVSIGFAGTVGRTFVDDPSPSETFEQLNARASYEVTGKVRANASAGAEIRQFEHGEDDHVTPVFGLGLSYTPAEATELSLSATRHILTSASAAGQDYESTELSGSIRQRFFQRVWLGLTGGWQNLNYFATVQGVSTNREDNYFFVQPSLDANITRWCTAGVYFLHRTNDSSEDLFQFDNNQVGLHAKLSF